MSRTFNSAVWHLIRCGFAPLVSVCCVCWRGELLWSCRYPWIGTPLRTQWVVDNTQWSIINCWSGFPNNKHGIETVLHGVGTISAWNSDNVCMESGLSFSSAVVFMGSKKYPGENNFDVFTNRHGGYSNATTDYETVLHCYTPVYNKTTPALQNYDVIGVKGRH